MTTTFAVPGIPDFNLTERDKEILSQTDEEYHVQTWDDLKVIVGSEALKSPTK